MLFFGRSRKIHQIKKVGFVPEAELNQGDLNVSYWES